MSADVADLRGRHLGGARSLLSWLDPVGRVAIGVVVLYVAAAIIGPALVQADPTATNPIDRLMPPGSLRSDGSRTVLGTDQIGRDLLGLILVGARVSLMVAFSTVLIAGIVGTLVGCFAGYYRGAVDSVVMRLADIQLAFPNILLAILIAGILGPSLRNVIITLSITSWVVFARVARSRVLSIIKEGYVESTRALGASTRHVLTRCVLPNVMPAVIVVGTVELGLIILTEASLSFLGLGSTSTMPSWGLIIADGRGYLADASWIVTFPGIALAVLVISVGLFGDRMRDFLDPKVRSRR